MVKDKDSKSATPLCYRKGLLDCLMIDIHRCMHTKIQTALITGDIAIISTTGVQGALSPQNWVTIEKHKKREWVPMFSDTVTCPPSLHMTLCGWHFTQLGWDYLKPPFVFLSIIMFALSWSYGISSGKLFAAAPLPPTWLTAVRLFWYTAVTDMFSFLCCLSSRNSVLILFFSVWANSVYKYNTKTVCENKNEMSGSSCCYILTT